MANRPYYVLLLRQDVKSPWEVEFGDFSRDVVRAESQDKAFHYAGINRKIITTTEWQSDINEAVRKLNADVK